MASPSLHENNGHSLQLPIHKHSTNLLDPVIEFDGVVLLVAVKVAVLLWLGEFEGVTVELWVVLTVAEYVVVLEALAVPVAVTVAVCVPDAVVLLVEDGELV